MCRMCMRDAQDLPRAKPAVFDQLRGLKRKHNLTTDPASPKMQKQVAHQPDLLAVSTQLSRAAYDLLTDRLDWLRETKIFALMTRTTQPLRLLIGVLMLGCSYWATLTAEPGSLRMWKILYAAGVAVHIGAQFWMTFVSGLVLYFALPRHDFGRVQEVLFPVYFTFNGVVSFLSLLAYLRMQGGRYDYTACLQVALLVSTILIEGTVRLYIVKPMLKKKHLKTQMEIAAQSGQEVGKLVLGELAHCPKYMNILRSFRAHHSKVAMGNMITLGCSLYTLVILVDSLCHG